MDLVIFVGMERQNQENIHQTLDWHLMALELELK